MSRETTIVLLSESDEYREVATIAEYESLPTISLESKKHPTKKALFAMELLMRGGIFTAKDGGEDSTGRAKLAQEPPSEVVERAVEIAEKAFDEFDKRGWLHTTTDTANALDMLESNGAKV